MREIVYPSWHDDARTMYANGVKVREIARTMGVSLARMSQITTPKWKNYLAQFRHPVGNRPKIDQINLSEFAFNPTFMKSPAQILREKKEKAKAGKDVKEIQAPKEDADMSGYDRAFEATQRTTDGKRVIGARIRCSKCQFYEDYFSSSGSATPRYAEQYFSRKGWKVGHAPRADLCPEHSGKVKVTEVVEDQKLSDKLSDAVAEAPNQMGALGEKLAAALSKAPVVTSPVNKPKETPNVFDAFIPQPPVEKTEPPAPEPVAVVPVLGKTEKRIIFAKLNDVYTDEQVGYSKDWTDAKVAVDLGVPVEWVAQVRDADFGPEINAAINATKLKELDELVAKLERTAVLIDKKIEQALSIDAKLTEADKAVKASIARYEELMKNLTEQDKKTEELVTGFNSDVELLKKIKAELASSASSK